MNEVRELAIREMNKVPDDKMIYILQILRDINEMSKSSYSTQNDDAMKKQRQFVRETAGKIEVDEQAINDMRMRSMI